MNKQFEQSQVNNFESKYELFEDKKLGEGMHTSVYECKLRGKFDIDDKASGSEISDPD